MCSHQEISRLHYQLSMPKGRLVGVVCGTVGPGFFVSALVDVEDVAKMKPSGSEKVLLHAFHHHEETNYHSRQHKPTISLIRVEWILTELSL
jgi:hypothetical protein